jgi:hypothetical protein
MSSWRRFVGRLFHQLEFDRLLTEVLGHWVPSTDCVVVLAGEGDIVGPGVQSILVINLIPR